MSKKKPFKLKKNEQVFLAYAFFICALISLASILILKQVYKGTPAQDLATVIGGVLGTSLSFFGSILVYKALRSQIKANKIISDQFKIQQFESKFNQMLHLHNENVKNLKLELTEIEYEGGGVEKKAIELKGKEVFEILCLEIEELFKTILPLRIDEEYSFMAAYAIFFNGKFTDTDKDYIAALENIKIRRLLNKKLVEPYILEGFLIHKQFVINYELIQGHSEKLSQYFRHLFLTVKFVANQDEDFISYEEKREYLRMLRAQLTNYEQVLMFYNWLSGFGKEWENETNKFFTDYRMIHNVFGVFLIENEYIREKYENLKTKDYKKIQHKSDDDLFESERWRR
ncbi:putative phage abortive infection protein [Flavobacterium sp. 102]|uniref:putative phage abortive infection protein n=1 Tax=Flavobacterium sp. 102 TaxID=2135623 RepID=UPI000EB38B95|nr:putative phage abortive infection protein [Flavobacterium sp. 102]RKS01676.1 putative phage abortive infection protein [Flavobacterium sp. 102]